jgi:alpha-1,6-mannosyltransferase
MLRALAVSPRSAPLEPAATLHLTNAYHEASGGIRTLYHALLDRAEETGRRMALVVPGTSDAEQRWGRTTTIYHVRAPHSPAIDRRYRLILPHRFLREGRGPLWEILSRVRPDVLEICDKYSLCYFAGLVRRRRRRGIAGPTLIGLSCERLDDNIEAYLGRGRASRTAAREFLGRAYLGMFDVHVANSIYTAEELRSSMRVPHLRPVHVCRMGVDPTFAPDIARRAEARARLLARCGDDRAALVIYAGRLAPEKQVDWLPTAVAGAARDGRPLHLVIAGDGPLRHRLEDECRRLLPGRAHFLGHIAGRDELASLVCACDAFLHVNPREPFGIGPLEAMALGTAVVLPAAGGVLSYAHSENAWLAAPTALALGDALRACLDHDVERERRIRNGRRTAERHAWPRVADEMFRVYDEARRAHLATMTETDGEELR